MRKYDDLLQCGIKVDDLLTAAIASISVKQCLSWIAVNKHTNIHSYISTLTISDTRAYIQSYI